MKKLLIALVCVALATPSYANDTGAIVGGIVGGLLLGGAIAGQRYAPPCYWQDVPVYDAYGNIVAWRRVCQ